ncbi:MAG: hypothetical protein KKB34_14780 [Bacteroidetes bacterium]|nr:hypothetical protein [Bacteroidota bacterium]
MKKCLIISLFFLSSAISIYFVLSCEMTSPVDNVKVIFNAASIKTTIAVDIVDAKTQEQIGIYTNQLTELSIEGPGKNYVVDISGKSQNKFKTNYGILCFALDNSITPTTENPIELILLAKSDGYLPVSYPLTISSEGGISVLIYIVNLNNLPQGVSSKTINIGRTDNSGKVTSPVEIATDPEFISRVTASMYVPVGTTIKDAYGEVLNGNLTASITYFSNRSDESTKCFPTGNFIVKVNEGKDIISNGIFYTGGFVNFNIIDESGRSAKNFDSSITLNMQIPNGTYNPDTKNNIIAGDIVPIWSYDETKGIWNFEKKLIIASPNAIGNYPLNFSSNHISNWNIDWFTTQTPQNIRKIRNTVRERDRIILELEKNQGTFLLRANINQNISPYLLMFKMINSSQYFYSSGYINEYRSFMNNALVPCEEPITIEVWEGCPFRITGTIQLLNICGLNEIIIPTNETNFGGNEKNIQITVSGYCSQDTTILIRPNVPIWINDGCRWKYSGLMENGKISFANLKEGNLYTFGIWYDNNFYKESYIIQKTSYNYKFLFPAELCK